MHQRSRAHSAHIHIWTCVHNENRNNNNPSSMWRHRCSHSCDARKQNATRSALHVHFVFWSNPISPSRTHSIHRRQTTDFIVCTVFRPPAIGIDRTKQKQKTPAEWVTRRRLATNFIYFYICVLFRAFFNLIFLHIWFLFKVSCELWLFGFDFYVLSLLSVIPNTENESNVLCNWNVRRWAIWFVDAVVACRAAPGSLT